MIAQLRKRHFRMWIAIAIVLPVLTLIAYFLSPSFPRDDFYSENVSFPELLKSVVSEHYTFNIKKNYTGGTVLEITQISRINPASELVTIEYRKNFSKNKTKQSLGIMGGNTTYRFYLRDIQLPFSVEVKDTIKKEVLAKIDF